MARIFSLVGNVLGTSSNNEDNFTLEIEESEIRELFFHALSDVMLSECNEDKKWIDLITSEEKNKCIDEIYESVRNENKGKLLSKKMINLKVMQRIAAILDVSFPSTKDLVENLMDKRDDMTDKRDDMTGKHDDMTDKRDDMTEIASSFDEYSKNTLVVADELSKNTKEETTASLYECSPIGNDCVIN